MNKAGERLNKEVGEYNFRGWYRFKYLKSEHWKQLRSRKIKSTPICEICQNNSAEQVHHKVYRSIYDVELSDLQAVCRLCHCDLHDVVEEEKQKPFSQFREEYEARERELDEQKKKERRKVGKGKLVGDGAKRYAIYLEKTAPFKFRGNRY